MSFSNGPPEPCWPEHRAGLQHGPGSWPGACIHGCQSCISPCSPGAAGGWGAGLASAAERLGLGGGSWWWERGLWRDPEARGMLGHFVVVMLAFSTLQARRGSLNFKHFYSFLASIASWVH